MPLRFFNNTTLFTTNKNASGIETRATIYSCTFISQKEGGNLFDGSSHKLFLAAQSTAKITKSSFYDSTILMAIFFAVLEFVNEKKRFLWNLN